MSVELAGCGTTPRVRVAVDVNNMSTDSNRPDGARIQLYCDEKLVVDSVLGNIYSGPPYRNSESVNRHWLLVVPGQHRLRVLVPKHGLALDTVLALDTLSFTSINLHHHIRVADTLHFVDGKGHPAQHIIPGDTASRIRLSKVPFG